MSYDIIGIDSQCVSYLIDTIHNIEAPADSLAPEKIALFRIYLYAPVLLYVPPTVTEECAAIRNIARKELHSSYITVLLDESPPHHSDFIKSRREQFKFYHKGKKDCRILAEAEDAGYYSLISYDTDFLNHFKNVSSSVKLFRPTEYWTQLNISHGAKPKIVPSTSNPLAQQLWWEW